MAVAAEMLDEIQKGVRAYKAFSEMEKVLSYMANLEQVEKETLSRIAVVKAEEERLKTLVHTAMTDAESIVATAQTEARHIESTAKGKAAAMLEAAGKKVATAQNKVATAEAKEAELEERAAELDKGILAKARELADLDKRISDARQSIAKLLGQ